MEKTCKCLYSCPRSRSMYLPMENALMTWWMGLGKAQDGGTFIYLPKGVRRNPHQRFLENLLSKTSKLSTLFLLQLFPLSSVVEEKA